MLRPDHPALTVALVKGFLASPDEALRVEAIRSLRDSRAAGRTDLLAAVARDAVNSPILRAEAIVGLSDSPPQQDLLLSLATGDNPTIQQEALSITARHPVVGIATSPIGSARQKGSSNGRSRQIRAQAADAFESTAA